MSTSPAYHTQGIIGFQHQSYEFSGGVAIQRLIRKEFRCPRCFHSAVKTYPIRTRRIQGLPYGTKTTFFELDIHRIYCPKCSEATVEEIPFISHPKARITTAFERTIIELRPEMTISAISKHFNLDWRVIKGVEKRYLKRKFKHVKLKKVKYIGIDEIAVGHDSEGKTAYLTIVRDLDSGSVLHVDRGKDGEALGGFLKRLRRSKAEIELVAMDMGRAFISWVEKYLPKANIVFDHFHVIKLMNEKIDKARRRITATLDDKEKEVLKKQRFTLLHNEEDLDEEAAEHLEEIKNTFQELADLHMMKEYLRSIYRVATSEWSAEIALRFWIKTAKGMKSDLLQKMVGTMEKHWKGILGFWRFGGATNAAMEGFNNKVRTMLRQAYGYRDDEYMILKIYDLPNRKLQVVI